MAYNNTGFPRVVLIAAKCISGGQTKITDFFLSKLRRFLRSSSFAWPTTAFPQHDNVSRHFVGVIPSASLRRLEQKYSLTAVVLPAVELWSTEIVLKKKKNSIRSDSSGIRTLKLTSKTPAFGRTGKGKIENPVLAEDGDESHRIPRVCRKRRLKRNVIVLNTTSIAPCLREHVLFV